MLLAGAVTRWQSGTTHLVKSLTALHLLREQHRLDAVEEAFEPADELSMSDTQLRIAWNLVIL